jgi:hypothetical protein
MEIGHLTIRQLFEQTLREFHTSPKLCGMNKSAEVMCRGSALSLKYRLLSFNSGDDWDAVVTLARSEDRRSVDFYIDYDRLIEHDIVRICKCIDGKWFAGEYGTSGLVSDYFC